MSQNVSVCEIDPSLKEELRKFRFRKATNNAAIIMKVDREKQIIFLEEELEDIDTDELREALPEHQPRFLVYSFKLEHGDGRISYPMCFIFSSPRDCKPEMMMMYAGSKLELVKEAEMTKVFEIRDLDELTDEFLHSKLLK